MNEFYRYQEQLDNRVEIVNLDDFLVDFRVPGDTITVDETWLQNKLKENLKKDHDIQKLKEQIRDLENCNKRAINRIKNLEIALDVIRPRTKILNTKIYIS